MYLLLIRNNIVSNGQKKREDILALGLDETKWREIFKLPFIVTQIPNYNGYSTELTNVP
jgi:hypothetical protein